MSLEKQVSENKESEVLLFYNEHWPAGKRAVKMLSKAGIEYKAVSSLFFCLSNWGFFA